MNWPNDPDGDVFRRLHAGGFDFDREHTIDFNIDFDSWPLSHGAISALKKAYPSCEVVEPDEEDIRNGDCIGYVQFQVIAKLTYELVMEVQAQAKNYAKPYGGWCESWGVWRS